MKLLIVTQIIDSEHTILGFFHRWVEEFAQGCDTVHVLCLEEGRHDLSKNVHVHSLGKEHGASRFARLVHFYRYIWSSRREYDAVFVHMNPIYVALGGVLWRLLGKKVSLWYTHGTVTTTLRMATLLTHIIFTASAESFRIKSKKVQVVGHGIDTDLFKSLPTPILDTNTQKQVRLVSVGRISRIKRQDLAIEVLHALRERGVSATLTIVGVPLTTKDSEYEKELFESVHKLGLHDYVAWAGAVANHELPSTLRQSDFLLHTSETGSLDKVVLEALATGVLVITTSPEVQKILPTTLAQICCTEPVSERLTSCVQNVLTLPNRVDLAKDGREFVVEHHALARLVGRISHVMAQ